MKDYNSKFNGNFEHFLILIGVISADYSYAKEELLLNIKYFRKCYKRNMSPYRALLLLNSYSSFDFTI